MEGRLTTRQHARVFVELDRKDLPHMSRYPPNSLARHNIPQEDLPVAARRCEFTVVVCSTSQRAVRGYALTLSSRKGHIHGKG